MATTCLVFVFMAFLVVECAVAAVYSSRILHRFSDEMKAVRVSRNGGYSGRWPERRSLEYYQMLLNSDLERQKMKLGPQYPFLFPSKGSKTYATGNDFYWLHYTWINIGKPSASFLVAVDTGSDLLWVPCDCIECAPLSEYNLDQELNVYSFSASRTGKQLTCDHQLCEMGSNCKSPEDFCPYKVSYMSENTSTSGLLVQDILHLSSGSAGASNSSVRAPVVLGCGRMQSGEYLNGAAPDGLLGLGPGEISVPSFLAKAGFTKNSFSLCFNEGEGSSGRIFFGDQGSSSQQTTRFLPLNGKYPTYIVQVEACCIGNSTCLEKTSFKALVDSGSSFTTLPDQIFKKVAVEFDKQVNANRATFPGSGWEYCYESSSKATIPTLMLKFAVNNTFLVHNPVIPVQETGGFCLAIFSNDNNGIAIIGQNYMTGYRMVFDRENLTLGWSKSNSVLCRLLALYCSHARDIQQFAPGTWFVMLVNISLTIKLCH